LGLAYNIPLVQSLRALEFTAGVALLSTAGKNSELLEPLNTKIPLARDVPGLRKELS